MDIPINEHADLQHTERSLLDDVQRMMDADEYTRATCSFPRREWRDILAEEVMRAESKILDLWLADKYGHRRIAISHTFDDTDAIRLQVPTRYVGIYVDDDGLLKFATTRTVSIVLDKTRDGLELYNAFPNMSQGNRTPIGNVAMLPYVQQTQRWKTANLSRRTYYRTKCEGGMRLPISWDDATSQMRLPIVEDETTLGHVLVGMATQIWNVDGDDGPIINERRNHARLLSRAFPSTWQDVVTLERVRDTEAREQELLASSSGYAVLPDLVERYCRMPVLTTEEPNGKPSGTKTKTRPARRNKNKERAQRRSKAASASTNKKARRKAAKSQKPRSPKTEQTAAPFQFKRVMTRFEEFGLDQHEQNHSIFLLALGRYAILANDIENECLVPGPMLEYVFDDTRHMLAYVPMSIDDARCIAERLDEIYESEDGAKGVSKYLDARESDAIMSAARTGDIRLRHAKDIATAKAVESIAQDPHWHIILPKYEMDRLEEDSRDALDRKIGRVCEDDAEHVVAISVFGEDTRCEPYEEKGPEQDEIERNDAKPEFTTHAAGDITLSKSFSATNMIRSYMGQQSSMPCDKRVARRLGLDI